MNKFKVGQMWRTRGGDMATIKQSRGDNEAYPIDAHIEGHGIHNFTATGKFWASEGNDSRHDLVELVTRVYIAGPMTGYTDLNFPAFNAAAAEYRKRGCFVINPAEMGGGDAELAMTEAEYAEHYQAMIRKDIAAVTTCDMLVVLPGYVMSRGAMAEIAVAQICGLAIVWPAS